MSSLAKHRAVVLCLLLSGCIAVVAGCDATHDQATEVTSPPTPAAISLRIAGAEGYQETLARFRGKVVLVDFWATWCAPCIEQFPHTVALDRKYRDRGLAVVAVSMNEPVDAPQVREFLSRHDAQFKNLLSKYDSGVKATEAFGLPGPVPCYRVYDRSGALHREFVVDPRAERQFTLDDVEAVVLELLGD